jgi:hypothetical protein
MKIKSWRISLELMLPDLEDEGVPEPVLKRAKHVRTARTKYSWEKRTLSIKDFPLFPKPNYTKYSPTSTPWPSTEPATTSAVRSSTSSLAFFSSVATTLSPTTQCTGATQRTARTRWSWGPCTGTGSRPSRSASTLAVIRTRRVSYSLFLSEIPVFRICIH